MHSRNDRGATAGRDTLELARLFARVPEEIRQRLLAAAPPLNLRKGASLFERGDSGGTMYVVQDGRIEISIINDAGRKIVLNQVGAGHCVGEISMIDGKARTASAIALETTRLFSVPRAAFVDAAAACPQLSINLMEILCERLRWVSDSVEEYALHSFELRLARRLLVLNRSFGDGEKSIGITQTDLADFAGATRESVNKTLMQWKQDGLVEVQRGRIFLKEMQVLERIAFGDLAD
ncbi:MAG: Crp/Fnr family transcriptional regulator [Rhizobiales bacterium]|nr:Crp/Fnr family transcriptional regulator [Hyphomicrobiales bacterium]